MKRGDSGGISTLLREGVVPNVRISVAEGVVVEGRRVLDSERNGAPGIEGGILFCGMWGRILC